MTPEVPTLLLRLYGVVQGVGFRPFACRLARRFPLTGSVANCGAFVEIRLQGKEKAKQAFLKALSQEAPERAAILKIESKEVMARPFAGFVIAPSRTAQGVHFVSPDIATCEHCRKELYEPQNRRYLHPFINCTACGPRLTILEKMPYDRERTAMKAFPMCHACEKEYFSPASRRFDAQPVCCHDCGPEVFLQGRAERGLTALRTVREALKAGKIAAVKGIGGFHLVCDAHNEESIHLLRERKHRPAKPFAVMFRNEEALLRYCEASQEELAELTGPRKPIVLLKRRAGEGELPGVLAPGNPMLGAMLPYAPVQMLLFDCGENDAMTDALVMTSGNVSGAPICRTGDEAQSQLGPFCDLILDNDRPILMRADDSVLAFDAENEPCLLRRSRGFAPLPFAVSGLLPGRVLGVGADLKNTFCLAENGCFYPSAHIGDTGDVRSLAALREAFVRMKQLLEIEPQAAGCDLHPLYHTRAFAQSLGLPVIGVQHHYAHILSCMAEHDFCREEVLGIALDGTGYGTDGTVWGGEFLRCSVHEFTRIGSFAPFLQPGGDVVAEEPWRCTAAMLYSFAPDLAARAARQLSLCSEEEFSLLRTVCEKRLGTVFSTSAGRFFDAVSALLGFCRNASFEGEAAMALQFAAERVPAVQMEDLPLWKRDGEQFFLRTDLLFRSLAERRLQGENPDVLARVFHEELAAQIAAGAIAARGTTGLSVCALSGGVFQNFLLLKLCKEKLQKAGFHVLCHKELPPNDGGISVGQAIAALARISG